MDIKQSLKKLLCKEFKNERYDMTPEGIVFPRADVLASGVYWDILNGEHLGDSKNIVVDQGLIHLLDVTLGGTAKNSTWYLMLYANNVSPAADWTAANFNGNASEISSNTEGYSDTTRREWVDNAAASNAKNNVGSEALFNIYSATSSTITVNGAALVSTNTKGGTSGVLMSATKYAIARTLQSGDDYKVGYQVTLTG